MNGREHRWFILVTTLVPLIGIGLAMTMLWDPVFGWSDLVSLIVMYTVSMLGISVGFHRLLAHRAFTASGATRVVLVTAGTMAGQGPPLTWAAHHRRHHRVADRPGDPHSPHLDFEPGVRGMLAGLWHAHVGWLLDVDLHSNPVRYCPDLAREKPLRWLSNHFVAVVLAGIVLAGLIGFTVGHTWHSLLTGMLWGGVVRLFLCNHVTYAINSVGHYFGRRRFPTRDESRNVSWLALVSMGEAWHNNHHAFPRSYRFGVRWWELDPAAAVIGMLERLGLATKVVRIDAGRVALKESGGSRVGASAEPWSESPQVPMAQRDPAAPSLLTDVE